MKRNKRKVLLIEPDYAVKYPPIGLMKLATYFRTRGDEVVFFKGDLRQFVIERIAAECVKRCRTIDPTCDWETNQPLIARYIRTKHTDEIAASDIAQSQYDLLLLGQIDNAKDYYRRGVWKQQPEWDFIGITTLFTFYWRQTVDTILFAKQLVKRSGRIMVGGILASLQPDQIEAATGIRPHVGVLDKTGEIDTDDDRIIDELPLDYSILDEIDYQYPMSDAYYGYTSRGCIRSCSFCAVRTLEPQFVPYIPLTQRVAGIRERYGEQRDLLLMDNNILASPRFADIVAEIRACGFERGATYTPPDALVLAFRNLAAGYNDRAYTRKCQRLTAELLTKIKNSDDGYLLYKVMSDHRLTKATTATRTRLLAAAPQILDIAARHYHPLPRHRYVDFNQGVDARLFNEDNVRLLSTIAIRPLRIAFDHIRDKDTYINAVQMAISAGIKNLSNYLLYNYDDHPDDLYERLRINVELSEAPGVSIYSFPMKYHPIFPEKGWEVDFSHNRDYIGRHWNRKYIRAVQAVLNSTKGKIGKGRSFFHAAFGSSAEEYREILEMPETFILYRYFFQWLDDHAHYGVDHWRQCWHACREALADDEWTQVLQVIHTNVFTPDATNSLPWPEAKRLLAFYTRPRHEINDPASPLYALKQQYDANPTIPLKRHH